MFPRRNWTLCSRRSWPRCGQNKRFDKHMIAAVYDCNVFFQAFVGKGPAFALLSFAEEKLVTLHVTAGILDEARQVLLRPCFQTKYPIITEESVAEFLAKVQAFAVVVTDAVPQVVSIPRDPKHGHQWRQELAGQAGFQLLFSFCLPLLGGDTEKHSMLLG